MLSIFDSLREVTFASIAVRMALSFLCGGLIGLEREYKRRAAGFRTHILICLGAAITTLTSQYLVFRMGFDTDLGRLGAQVIAGIGFIGAGSILVTRHQRVKGLTTAAGLWASAIIGLCFGAGFYEGGIAATLLILLAELLFARVERMVLSRVPQVNLYVECRQKDSLDLILRLLQEEDVKLQSMEVMRASGEGHGNVSAILSLSLPKKYKVEALLLKINRLDDVVMAEEL